MTTMTDEPGDAILGVDTHLDAHVGVVIDFAGRVQGTLTIETTPRGYRELLRWAQHFGQLRRAGVEGTGAYGVGLARFLTDAGIEVIEVDRPRGDGFSNSEGSAGSNSGVNGP